MYVFGGSASEALAQKIASKLGTPLGEAEVTHFANDEVRVWVKTNDAGRHAIVVQSFSPPADSRIMEFCFLADALRRQGVTEITALIPWLGYSKQDKVFRPGEALSAYVVAQIIQLARLSRIFVFDLHNPAILEFFTMPVVHLSAQSLFVEYFKKTITPHTVVVAPDAGAVQSSTAFAEKLGAPIACVTKRRDHDTGCVTVEGVNRVVGGADIIIVDDMIVTGATLVETAKLLKKQGASTISVAATHHLYVRGAQTAIEGSGIDRVVVTDTIAKPKDVRSQKLIVLSVAPLAVNALKSQTKLDK